MEVSDFTFQGSTEKIDEILTLLKDFGVVILPDFLDSDDLNNLKSEFELLLSSPDDASKKETPYSDGRAIRITKKKLSKDSYPVTCKTFNSEFMESFKNSYLTVKSTLNEEIFVVKDVKGSKHIANDMHFDVIPTLKFFIYLTDTTAKNGAFTCVPKSHLETKKIRESADKKISFKNREYTRELNYKEEDVFPIEGPAGTLIIFTSETFHKAGIVSEGERMVMRGHSRLPKYESKNASLGMKIKHLFGIN
ncbi:MAG: phytanoyl-CoA dioxygenase family protein [Vicingaceae bacterium]